MDDPHSRPDAAALPPIPAFGAAPGRPPGRLPAALAERMQGPGGVYNLGNALGLGGGLWLAVAASAGEGGPELGRATEAAMAYLAGSGSAAALTLATLVFFWSGEVYHRAWAAIPAPDPALNRQGDLLSALGALALGMSLALLGHPVLAATAGLLHALGKLGSALHRPGTPALPRWPGAWPDPFRSLVLLSRVPAAGIALAALWAGMSGSAPAGPPGAMAEPALLLACTAVWAKADLMLFRS